jgi:hypothetical protein
VVHGRSFRLRPGRPSCRRLVLLHCLYPEPPPHTKHTAPTSVLASSGRGKRAASHRGDQADPAGRPGQAHRSPTIRCMTFRAPAPPRQELPACGDGRRSSTSTTSFARARRRHVDHNRDDPRRRRAQSAKDAQRDLGIWGLTNSVTSVASHTVRLCSIRQRHTRSDHRPCAEERPCLARMSGMHLARWRWRSIPQLVSRAATCSRSDEQSWSGQTELCRAAGGSQPGDGMTGRAREFFADGRRLRPGSGCKHSPRRRVLPGKRSSHDQAPGWLDFGVRGRSRGSAAGRLRRKEQQRQ